VVELVKIDSIDLERAQADLAVGTKPTWPGAGR